MEEGHPAVHQPDDGGSAVSSQLVGKATLITQVHDANAHTWGKRKKKTKQTAIVPDTITKNTSSLVVMEKYHLKEICTAQQQRKQSFLLPVKHQTSDKVTD